MRSWGKHGRREPMAKVDTAWLRMERPTNLMMITGVMMFETPLDIQALRKVIQQKFLAYPRFRQKAVDTPTGAFWEDDEDFDIDWHVRRTALPGEAGKRELQDLASQLASTPLDHSKPLWQFHLVERYQGGSALIARIHHCYADGIALVQVMLSLTDVSPEPHPEAALHSAWLKDDGRRVTERFFALDMAQVEKAMKFGSQLLHKGMEVYQHPSLAGVLAKEGGAIAAELAHALSLSDDPPTTLKGPLGVVKRCAWAEPIPLAEVKAVAHGFKCTVNDILLAAVAGALRGYLRERGEQVDDLTIRATVPVNLRPLEHAKKLGNHFGLVFLDLPIGEDNPVTRVYRVAECMAQIKSSKQALVTYGALAALGMAPSNVQHAALEFLSRKATTVATNVPGPQMPLYMAGARMRQTMFWVPQSGSIGIGISILSYDGGVQFGLIADRKRLPEPEAVIERFRPEFEKLLYLLLMEEWGEGLPVPAHAEALLKRYG